MRGLFLKQPEIGFVRAVLKIYFFFSMEPRYFPVMLAFSFAISSGVPVAMIWPPPAPPSGPRSTIQSAVLITSRIVLDDHDCIA